MITTEQVQDAISYNKEAAGKTVTEALLYKAAESGMADKARYKLANMCAHGYEVTGAHKVSFLQRDKDRYMIDDNGDMFRLDKCL